MLKYQIPSASGPSPHPNTLRTKPPKNNKQDEQKENA